MIESLQWVQSTKETGLEQAQNQKLLHTLFPNDVLEKIKIKIDQTAQKMASFPM